MKVIIYSTVDVFYYSFYIEGLYRLYGKKNVKFSMTGFPAFASRVMAIRLNGTDQKLNIVIDALDTSTIYNMPLEWCDVYGKVNYSPKNLPLINTEKIFPIGASFGIRIWSFWGTLKFALANYYKSEKLIHDKRYFFTTYWRQFKRLPLLAYQKRSQVKADYVFFVSSLWKKEMETNASRARFMVACIETKGIKFEGGFAPRSDNENLGFDNLIGCRVSPQHYLRKIKRSFVTFNTPAVQNCFGWKLAEFMVLGKAIISTEIPNLLPVPLLHRKHLHFVSSEKTEIQKAVLEILENKEYREKLEKNSREYYNTHLAPEVVLQRLMKHARQIN